MANRRNYNGRQKQVHRPSYLVSNNDSYNISTQDQFEFDESDVVWSSNLSSSPKFHHHHQQVIRSSNKQLPRSSEMMCRTASTRPVNIPDWSKILRNDDNNEQQNQRSKNEFYVYEDDEEQDGIMTPPHEFLAKQMAMNNRIASSFSVHEGVGRTLKGRDLSRVRNAIWAQTGFQD